MCTKAKGYLIKSLDIQAGITKLRDMQQRI